ncbi:hypothetical protein SDC9_181274 [bioreactor metagenome]|uniref:Uncharacterized protein n=1 Tax=bioreactor metagenome TaxID=1076179 RepID=A0A645H612_9ZZZZ
MPLYASTSALTAETTLSLSVSTFNEVGTPGGLTLLAVMLKPAMFVNTLVVDETATPSILIRPSCAVARAKPAVLVSKFAPSRLACPPEAVRPAVNEKLFAAPELSPVNTMRCPPFVVLITVAVTPIFAALILSRTSSSV